MERFWKVLSLTLIVGIVAVVGASVVFAQDDTPEPPYPGEGFGPKGGRHGGRLGVPGVDREEVRTRLAEALGLTLEEFDAAIADGETLASLAEDAGVSLEDLNQVMDELHDEALALAVEEGRITQEQADQIIEDRAARRAVEEIFDRDELHAKLAEALGMTVDEFESATAGGEKLSALAEQADVSMEDLRSVMEGYHADVVAEALDQGLITQEQADQMLEHPGLPEGGCGGPFPGLGGPRHGGGFPRGGRLEGSGFRNQDGLGDLETQGGA
jgi:lambda repressor-like predicted transcriptional regulator